ncbi:MAG: hypothetical protein OEX19_12405 [Gammaproteobacteria bacterium]|nr:hypothetical protein [Gammaproteobacteria bacterium]
MYHFADLINSADLEDGKEPDVPACVISYQAKYPSSLESTWCFCDSTFDAEDIDSLNIESVSDELAVLLDSAKLYAPAYALAFSEVNSIWPQTKKEYEQNLINALKEQLQKQNENGFFLCESRLHETGYLSKGEFVWVVKYIPEIKEVLWVSSEYEIYQDPVSKFILDESSLNKLNSIQLKSLTSC